MNISIGIRGVAMHTDSNSCNIHLFESGQRECVILKQTYTESQSFDFSVQSDNYDSSFAV